MMGDNQVKESVLMRLGKISVKWILYITSLSPLYFLLILESLSLPKKLGWHNIGDIIKGVKKIISYNICLSFDWPRKTMITMFLILLSVGILIGILFKNQYTNLKDTDHEVAAENIRFSKHSLDRVDTMSYVGTYIVPMLTMDLNSWRSIVVNVVLLIVLGKFYVLNSQVFINPIFNLFNFNIYRSGENYYLTKESYDAITGRIERGDQICSKELIANLFVLR